MQLTVMIKIAARPQLHGGARPQLAPERHRHALIEMVEIQARTARLRVVRLPGRSRERERGARALVGVEGNPMASVLPYPSPAMLTVSSLQLMRLAPPGSIRRRALGTVLGSWGDERRWSTPTPPGRYPLDTFWIPAAVFSVDTDLLRRIGGFDTDYFLYLEDTDLCHRINRQSPGALAAVADTEPGFHEVGGSAHTSGASQLARRSQWDSAVTYAAREAGWQWRCAELAIRGGRFVTSLGDRTGELPPWDGTPAPRPGADQGRTRS